VVYLVQSFASEPLNIAPAGRRHVGGQDDIGATCGESIDPRLGDPAT
jgi:hypothetical protein